LFVFLACLALFCPGTAGAGDAVLARGAGKVRLACPSEVLAGEPFLVRLTSSWPLKQVRMFWLGKSVQVSVSQWNDYHVALGMMGSDVRSADPGEHQLMVKAEVGGQSRTFRRDVRLLERSSPVQRLSVDPKMVTPPKKALERIRRERKEIAEALSVATPERRWTTPFLRPVDGRVSGVYGLQRVFNGKPRSRHRGLDTAANRGTPVQAAADGTVVLVGDHYFAGESVYVDHGLGVLTLYFHLDEALVREGEQVERGQTIGKVGATGRVTGPHLHLSVSVLGRLVDPEPLLEQSTDELLRN
jgi:biotin carboxyl carrier protein